MAIKPKRGSRAALPITFGPGLIAAYDLEKDHAKYPRVLIDASIAKALSDKGVQAWPLANHGIMLRQCFRVDPTDKKSHLDLLSARIVRADGESMHTSPDGFTVTWEVRARSTHALILQKARQLADAGIDQNETCERVCEKYEWLRMYCEASREE